MEIVLYIEQRVREVADCPHPHQWEIGVLAPIDLLILFFLELRNSKN